MKKSLIIGIMSATIFAIPVFGGIIIDNIFAKLIAIFFLVFLVCSFGVFYEQIERLEKELEKLNSQQKKLATKKKWKPKK